VAGERVESDRFGVGRIEEDDIVEAFGRDAAKDVLHQVAFGFDDDDGAAVADVLRDEVAEERALASAGRTEYVQVMQRRSDVERQGLAACNGTAGDDSPMAGNTRCGGQPLRMNARLAGEVFPAERPAEQAGQFLNV